MPETISSDSISDTILHCSTCNDLTFNRCPECSSAICPCCACRKCLHRREALRPPLPPPGPAPNYGDARSCDEELSHDTNGRC